MEFDITFTEENDQEQKNVLQLGQESRNRNRRNKLDRAAYDRMQKAERQKLALDKLQSDSFQDVLKRYYSGGVSDMNNVATGGKDVKDYSKKELIEKFYQDRIWSEWNTVGIANDVGQVLAKDSQYKGDWAEITQIYADLPYFGGETIGFTKWAKDFVPALIVDPVNLYTLGAGKIVAREAGKTAIEALGKAEFQKLAARKAGIEIGLKEGAIGTAIGGAADAARQAAEIDAGLATDYNVTRTLISAGAGGVAQGTIGGFMSAWSAKGKAGKFYDKGDGFKSDYDRDFGLAGSEADVTYTGKSGTVKRIKNKVSSKEAPTTVQNRTSEAPVINNKVNEIKVKTPTIVDDTVLPKELKGAKPRYNYGSRNIELEFDNDIARALYIVGGKGKSVSHEAYISFLQKAGVEDISKKAQAIRDSIKAQAKSGSDTAKVSAEIPKKQKIVPQKIVALEETVNGVKRKTPVINLSKINADESYNVIVREVKDGINTLIKEGKIRTTERVGLLERIRARGVELLGEENANLLDKELKIAAKMSPELAPTVYAGRVKWLLKSREISEIRKLADNAVDDVEKLALAEQLIKAMKERNVLIKNHVDTVQAASDVMNQQKLIVEITEADKLRIETEKAMATGFPDLLDKVSKLSPSEKIKIVSDLAEISNNNYLAHKLIKQVNKKMKEKDVSFMEALNEYTTANLLFDPTTHEVNIISTIANFQKQVVQQYAGGLINMVRGNKNLGISQFNMAADLFAGQFRFFQIALKKARLSWKANRSIGDSLEHRFDGRQQRNMETYLEQLKESDSVIKRFMGSTASPLGKLVFTSLRLLGAGDTLTKNIIQRAARVANVNQRMRTFYPELLKKGKKINKANIVKLQDSINDVKENIRFEQAADAPNNKKLSDLNDKLTALEKQKTSQTPFEQKWSELYYQYEDEFGNFRETKTFNSAEALTLDDLTKSVANDPTYTARHASFTENLKNQMLDSNQFYPDQQQSKSNVGQWILDQANNHPSIRLLTSIHFIKTPVNLVKTAWHMTPIVNLLSREYRAMLNASDPVVRNKAQAIMGVGTAVYGHAFYMAYNTDRLTGSSEKDPKHRYAYVTVNEDGTKEYTSMLRLFPLSIPYMIAADIRDMFDKFGDIWDDPLHSAAQERVMTFAEHFAGSSFSLWSNIFASNLMTQDFFKLTELFSQTNKTTEEGMKNVGKLEQYFGRSASKLVPVATGWRWTNKVFADAEAELMTMSDHIKHSSPYSLSKIINEYAGNEGEPEIFGDALSPKRDPLGNPYPKPKGLMLGKWQDIFSTTTHWSASMLDSNGEKIKLTPKALEKLTTSNIQWDRPAALMEIGRKESLNLRETTIVRVKDPITGTQMNLPEGTTAYEAMLQVKGKFKINGKNLNETFKDELENPTSQYNTRYAENRLLAGKYEGDQYLLDKIREFETEARDWIKGYGLIVVDGKQTTVESLKRQSETMLEQLYQ